MIQRILYACHSRELGGAELYLEGLIRYTASLADREVALICRTDAVLDQWVERIEALGVHVHRLDLRGPGDVVHLWHVIRRADILHLLVAYPAGKYQLAVALVTAAAGRPLVVTHQIAVDIRATRLPHLRRLVWRAAFRLYGRVASWNIASSRVGWDLLVRRYGFSERSTELIYNGADLGLFNPVHGRERERVRRALVASVGAERWPADIFLAVTIARLTAQKGLLDLVEAAALVTERLPRARFLLVGEGEMRPQLEGRIAEHGLQERFRLAGGRPLQEIAGWLGAVDLFVLSSHDEGMPLALLEAMAAGCPVVATAVGGVPDVVVDAEVGRLVAPADVPALAGAIEQVLGGRERERMASAARRRVMEAFDVRTCYRKTAALYGNPA